MLEDLLLIEILPLIFVALIYVGIVCVVRNFRPKKQLNHVTKLILKETVIQRWIINLLLFLGIWALFSLLVYAASPALMEDQSNTLDNKGLRIFVSLFSAHIINNFLVNLIKRASSTVIPNKQNI